MANSNLETAKAELQKLHDCTTSPPNRSGYVSAGRYYNTSGGCLAMFGEALRSFQHNQPSEFVFSVTHGDGAPLSWDALVDQSVFNKELAAFKQPFNKLVPTPRSRQWVEFLLSPESPWRLLHEHIVDRDVDTCNNSGFIYTRGVPAKLAYNFAMAVRFPWELPRQFALWLELLKHGTPASTALYIAANFELSKGAKDIEGPYDIMYPWSFLESSDTTAVARFILGTPNMHDSNTVSPNVQPLWKIDGQAGAVAAKVYDKWLAAETLTLTEIVGDLNQCVSAAEEQLTTPAP